MKRTDRLSGADKVRQKLLSVRIIDGQPEKAAVLDEIRKSGPNWYWRCNVDVVILRDEKIVIGRNR